MRDNMEIVWILIICALIWCSFVGYYTYRQMKNGMPFIEALVSTIFRMF